MDSDETFCPAAFASPLGRVAIASFLAFVVFSLPQPLLYSLRRRPLLHSPSFRSLLHLLPRRPLFICLHSAPVAFASPSALNIGENQHCGGPSTGRINWWGGSILWRINDWSFYWIPRIQMNCLMESDGF